MRFLREQDDLVINPFGNSRALGMVGERWLAAGSMPSGCSTTLAHEVNDSACAISFKYPQVLHRDKSGMNIAATRLHPFTQEPI